MERSEVLVFPQSRAIVVGAQNSGFTSEQEGAGAAEAA